MIHQLIISTKVKIVRPSWLAAPALFGLAAACILGPLLKPGFVLTLDMVFTPVMRLPSTISSSYALHAAFHLLNLVLPSDTIEKMVLFLILFLAGFGMHRLAQYLRTKNDDLAGHIGTYAAGIFYTINPFTYDRLMAGQYNVLFGYALLPFFVRSLLVLCKNPSLRSAAFLSLWAILIGIVSIHTLGMILIFGLIAIGITAWQKRHQTQYLKQLTKFTLLALIIFIFASSYWLVPLLADKGSTASTIAGFGNGDVQAFATVGSGAIGKLGNIVRLQGFWVEDRSMYTLPQEHIKAWGLLALLLWILIITGIVSAWRAGKRTETYVFGITLAASMLLAIGIFSGWLAAHVPLFAGYREPEKFVALVALCYAVFLAQGVTTLLQYVREQAGKYAFVFASAIALLITLAFTSTMLWGCNNQLRPVHYPADWFTINQTLSADHDKFDVLFLPWHLYMYFDFAGRIIANPAPSFFDKPVIVSDNVEFKNASAANSTPTKRALDRILPTAETSSDLAIQLANLHIKYILLAKDNDYQNYAYLSKQPHIHLVADTATIALYQNDVYGRGK